MTGQKCDTQSEENFKKLYESLGEKMLEEANSYNQCITFINSLNPIRWQLI